MGKDKPIWRLAFFSRLEERKGIKLFVDAVSALNVTGLPNFEVRRPSGRGQRRGCRQGATRCVSLRAMLQFHPELRASVGNLQSVEAQCRMLVHALGEIYEHGAALRWAGSIAYSQP